MLAYADGDDLQDLAARRIEFREAASRLDGLAVEHFEAAALAEQLGGSRDFRGEYRDAAVVQAEILRARHDRGRAPQRAASVTRTGTFGASGTVTEALRVERKSPGREP
ncbi:MAG: hypothetical protein ACRDRJ_07465 [Streptosporangiaceae bacterium]